MAKYYIKMRVDARFTPEVEADSIAEAKKKAEIAFSEADFGDAEDIDGEIIHVEDEDGNIIETE